MPEIRFTEEELQSVQKAQQEVDDTFEATFGHFRQWLDESDMEHIRAHRRETVRRDTIIRLGLEGLVRAFEQMAMRGSDPSTFVDHGLDASVEAGFSSDPVGIYKNEALWAKLHHSPDEAKRREEIRAEVLARYGLIGPTRVVTASEAEGDTVSVDVGDFSNELDSALEREGLNYREDALNGLLV
jgi:hypothetical protein